MAGRWDARGYVRWQKHMAPRDKTGQSFACGCSLGERFSRQKKERIHMSNERKIMVSSWNTNWPPPIGDSGDCIPMQPPLSSSSSVLYAGLCVSGVIDVRRIPASTGSSIVNRRTVDKNWSCIFMLLSSIKLPAVYPAVLRYTSDGWVYSIRPSCRSSMIEATVNASRVASSFNYSNAYSLQTRLQPFYPHFYSPR